MLSPSDRIAALYSAAVLTMFAALGAAKWLLRDVKGR